MRRQAILLMATMTAALIATSGVALAEFVTCNSTPPCYGTPENDGITGTASGETIKALGGNDSVNAGGGNDTVYGGAGSDNINTDSSNDTPGSTDHSYGGGGNDLVVAVDNNEDIVNCGKGKDEVYYDEGGIDTIKACEIKHAFGPP